MSELERRPVAVTAAFNSQLKSLCIKEFPCGFGQWRVPSDTIYGTTVKSMTSPGVITSTVPEPTACYETVEDLQELAIKTPYNVDCTWSSEATTLREIAVKNPEKLTNSFVLSHFKSLRIVDKKVTEIDEGLLNFKNLQQLTLSANLISLVDSQRLPKCLKELELSANKISDISSLCRNPPPLIHLGLGYNQITSISGHMTPLAWRHLLSLDLSCNNLPDLYSTINTLKTLPKLRNLVMQGNPLALVPGYRGYVIDSIRALTILDDTRISADEKHYFKGLSKLRDIPMDEARLTIAISVIQGVKMPPEIEDPESNTEYPKIEHRYHVEFKFLELPHVVRSASPVPSIPTISITSPEEEEGATEPYVDQEDLEVKENIQTDALKLNATDGHTWTEEPIEINYSNDFHTRKLSKLRDFLQQGIEFSIVESRLSFVLEDPNAPPLGEDEPSSGKGRPDSKADKGGKKSGKKEEKRKDSAKAKGKDGKKGKGKQEEMELFELPRTHRLLGSCHVSLASLLDGEFEISADCICQGEKEDAGQDNEEAKKADGADKKKTGKEHSEKASKGGQKPNTDSKKGGKDARGKSAVKGGKELKGKGKTKEENITEEDDEPPPPPPLATFVKITLHRWKSAKEATLAQDGCAVEAH
ncbi:leucine-rich repeat-containing protein 43 [Nematostella vectensis]|uniref:leucine-rich repeat-containing protein 43 n=1 Tax=Nematostella vectensis TaxID=45351 RepID=UPI0020770BCE|nr:leucine-rich repeat-containing protein 43 [Nematostella vectensis]